MITDQIKENLFRLALQGEEVEKPFPWHEYAADPKSSQTFCISAFGSFRSEELSCLRDKLISSFICEYFQWMRTEKRPRRWTVSVEVESPELLNEFGKNSQPTSIDALLESTEEVIAVESKFVRDADEGFGTCGHFRKKRCNGFYGPGSNNRTKTFSPKNNSWCRLETWDGDRTPRLYWTLGRQYFQPRVFEKQIDSQVCPLRDANYQLMRNFLFAAEYARRYKKSSFAVLAICPKAKITRLEQQVDDFRSTVLAEPFQNRIRLVSYESLIALLRASGNSSAIELGDYLQGKIYEHVE